MLFFELLICIAVVFLIAYACVKAGSFIKSIKFVVLPGLMLFLLGSIVNLIITSFVDIIKLIF